MDPEKRLSAEEALQHPFITGEDVKEENRGHLLDNIKKFNAKRKFKGVAVAFMSAKRIGSGLSLLDRIKAQQSKEAPVVESTKYVYHAVANKLMIEEVVSLNLVDGAVTLTHLPRDVTSIHAFSLDDPKARLLQVRVVAPGQVQLDLKSATTKHKLKLFYRK